MSKLRVLVVEDSITVRRRICDVLGASSEFEVAAEAKDGRAAIESCLELRPDVITMDMMLPGVTGLSATEYIMAYCPTPILIVSSSFNRGDVFKTFDALAAGAVDVMEKPTGMEAEGVWERALLSSLRVVARVRVITHPRARLQGLTAAPQVTYVPQVATRGKGPDLVALGASTGGPGALVQILAGLPRDFQLPVLIVLHLGENFAASFAEWLATQAGRPVQYARDGESLQDLNGQVRLAPPGRHLALSDGRLILTRDPERHSCRPSVDVLFESLARAYGPRTVACLLTGMGRDGARGLLALRMAGAATIAESEASCTVYGMPREAVQLGAAEQVLAREQIAPALVALVRGAGGLP